jgi:hypothetical protein
MEAGLYAFRNRMRRRFAPTSSFAPSEWTSVASLGRAMGFIGFYSVVNGLLNRASLTAGLIIKIFIIVALSKAIQSAIAYQRAQKSAALQASLAEE